MKITLRGQDGSVAIMELASGADKDEAIRKLNDCHADKQYEHVDGSFDVPESREFRDAWKMERNKIVICPKLAKDIHLERIRAARDEQLQKLDIETLKNISNPFALQKIEQEKQRLRDLPQNVNVDINKPIGEHLK